MKIQQVIKKAKNLKASAKIFILVAISLLILIINYFILMNDHLDFQLVDRDGIVENISTTGIVIRNEEVLSSENYTKKNLKYLLSDGERIQKNGIVAEIYASPKDVNASYRLENLNKELEILERLSSLKNNISKGVNFVNSQINEQIRNLLLSSYDVNPIKEKEYREKITYLLNERQIILGKEVNFDSRINYLKSEKEKIISSISNSTGVVNAPNAGIFMGNIDGYEKIIGEDNILDFDFESLDFKTINLNSNKNSKNDIGKIITSEEWYIVCKLDEKEVRKINQDDEAVIDMQLTDGDSGVPCVVKSIKKMKKSNNYIAIFSCNYMNKNIAFLRKENFKIDIKKYKGLKVDRNAVYKYGENENGSTWGVYIKRGNYLKFKKINPIYWGEKEVICSYSLEEAADENYIQVGDLTVKNGKNLYDGKIIK